MADFGQSGKITVRTNHEATTVKLSAGEYLAYKLKVEGARPIFAFSCSHRPRLRAEQFAGHPKQVYEWTWSRTKPNPSGIPNELSDDTNDTYVVLMQFAAAIKYTLRVEQRDVNDVALRTLKDIDFETQQAEEDFPEGLDVFQA